jgi:methylmalonyl-CoA mutase cobalamin-binding domain/chain
VKKEIYAKKRSFMTQNKARVLLAKPGLDGHDKGVKTVVYALREAGIEVIYTGLHKTPEEVVKTAVEEDVDIIGLSILSGAHLPISTEVMKLMVEAGIGDKPLMVGGVIPMKDVKTLEDIGVKGVFPVDSPYEDIVDFIRENAHVG